jgi:hypothetical protein
MNELAAIETVLRFSRQDNRGILPTSSAKPINDGLIQNWDQARSDDPLDRIIVAEGTVMSHIGIIGWSYPPKD